MQINGKTVHIEKLPQLLAEVCNAYEALVAVGQHLTASRLLGALEATFPPPSEATHG